MGLIIDNFAGGGGASTGLELALGRKVDIAINHDPDAIAMHKANHPYTTHYQESVWDIDPRKVCNGKEVDVAWFSPDCKHFSKAKGGKPVDKHIRGLAWIVLRWAGTVRPKVIFLENVEEFKTWGPVRRGHPIKSKAGQTFNKFISQLRDLGYDVDYRELVAADYGAPTTRKRFFMIARCDGKPIRWSKPTHAPREKAKAMGLKPYRAASEIIDWSIPCPSIFERKKPLKEATLKRIVRGLKKFVFDEKDPFIIPIGYGENKNQAPRVHDIDDPIPTITTGGHHYLISPMLVDYHFNNDTKSVEDPHNTITTVRGNYLCEASLVPFIETLYTTGDGSSIDHPLPTIVAVNKNYLCAAYITKHFGGNYKGSGADLRNPLPTVTAADHSALVEAFLIRYYSGENNACSLRKPLGTITTRDRFGLVTVNKIKYQIVDIGMRMLTPRELYNAQGFPNDYIIDTDCNGNKYPLSKQIARCGNAVPPAFAEALARANCPTLCAKKKIKTMRQLNDYTEQISLF